MVAAQLSTTHELSTNSSRHLGPHSCTLNYHPQCVGIRASSAETRVVC